MPRCEGIPQGPCPKRKNDSTVKLTQGDLMCCPECTEIRFPTTVIIKTDNQEQQQSPDRSEKRKRRKCICNITDREKFMIICDWCTTWYHGDCVGVKEGEYKRGERYKCTDCKKDKKLDEENEDHKHKLKTDEKKRKKSKQLPQWQLLY